MKNFVEIFLQDCHFKTAVYFNLHKINGVYYKYMICNNVQSISLERFASWQRKRDKKYEALFFS